MGRPKHKGKRTNGRLSRSKDALVERVQPADYIIARRLAFAWHRPTKGPDGRVGEIDQDICDGIGQLHACGLLDNHGFDPVELRDKGRLYGKLYWTRYSATAPRTGKYDRSSRSTSSYDGMTPADLLFARMDDSLQAYERQCVFDLVVDTTWGDAVTPWAAGLIAEALLQRGKMPPRCLEPIMWPTLETRAMLNGCIRGLCALVDGSLPRRWERAA